MRGKIGFSSIAHEGGRLGLAQSRRSEKIGFSSVAEEGERLGLAQSRRRGRNWV